MLGSANKPQRAPEFRQRPPVTGMTAIGKAQGLQRDGVRAIPRTRCSEAIRVSLHRCHPAGLRCIRCVGGLVGFAVLFTKGLHQLDVAARNGLSDFDEQVVDFYGRAPRKFWKFGERVSNLRSQVVKCL